MVNYHLNSVYSLLRSMNITWTTSRFRHPKQDSRSQADFKKIQIESIKFYTGHVSMDQIDFQFQDRAPFGQQSTTKRLWIKKGYRTQAARQQHFFGALCATDDETEALIAPHVDKEVRSRHIKQISEKTDVVRHAVVIIDDTDWHRRLLTEKLSNVSMMKRTPYSQELNLNE